MKHIVVRRSLGLVLILCGLFAANAQNNQFINLWGGGGYSLLYHGIEQTKTSGGLGYSVGAGYEMNFNNFILLGGVEFMQLSSTTKLTGYTEGHTFDYATTHPGQPGAYTVNYSFNNYSEKHKAAYLNIPLQFGMKFSRYYALLGARVGVGLFGSYNTSSQLTTQGIDSEFVDPMEDMPKHFFGTRDFPDKGNLNLGLNVSPGAEIGLYLDEWFGTFDRRGRRVGPSYRVGLFADYGLLNMNSAKTENKILTPPVENPLDVKVNGLMSSTLAQDKRFGNLYAGLKFTVLFDVSKSQKKPQPQIQDIPFYAKVVDGETNENVSAELTLRMNNRQIMKKQTDAQGMVTHDVRAGRYQLKAVAGGDYLDYTQTISIKQPDTLLIPMKKIPLLAALVSDAQTNEPLEAEITLKKLPEGTEIYSQKTDRTGFISQRIASGKYQIAVAVGEYEFYQNTIDHTKNDTLKVRLLAIKKDTKVVLHNLFFEFGTARMLPESEPAMGELYQFLSNNPEVKIEIVGHTDNTGTDAFNQKLSEDRAKAVYDTLVQKGIDMSRLTSSGKGSKEPVDTNETEEGRAMNRRVEFVVQ